MNLTPHFTRDEFESSGTAARLNINNSLPEHLMGNAAATAAMLETIRDRLSARAGRDIPIRITSGYRCQALNDRIGGSAGSHHLTAQAADFVAPEFGTPYEICRALQPVVDELGIGQLIHEYGRWVHVSTVRPSRVVNRVITITAAGTTGGIQQA